LIQFINRSSAYFFAAAFLIAAGCFAYFQDFFFVAVPIAVLAVFLLVQYPEYLFYLLMLSIPWSVEFNFSSGLGTDLPDEPLMLVGALSVIIYVVYQRKNITSERLHPLIAIIALQLLWSAFTVVTSTDIVASIKYLLAKTWYLLAFLVLPVFLFRDEKILKRSALILLCSMMVVMVVALVRQGFNYWSFEKVNDALQPFFRNHVNYSALLVCMVPILIAVIRLRTSKLTRLICYCFLIISFIAVYLSYARGAWLALIAGLLAYGLLRKRLLFLGFLFFLSVVIASVFWLGSNERFVKFSNEYKSTIYHTNFKEHLVATYQLKDLSNAERFYRWIAGVRMIKDNWQTGFGPSTFYDQYKSYTLPAFKTYVSDNKEHSTVHNYFLMVLIDQGVIGCLLFVMLIAALFWYAQSIYFRTNERFWKIVVSAIASILIMQCVINFLSDMIETDKVGSVFYLCVASLIIADIKTRKTTSNFAPDIQRIS
jgi:O-antigen ligase